MTQFWTSTNLRKLGISTCRFMKPSWLQSRQDCQQTQQSVNGLWETMEVTKYRWRNGIRKFDAGINDSLVQTILVPFWGQFWGHLMSPHHQSSWNLDQQELPHSDDLHILTARKDHFHVWLIFVRPEHCLTHLNPRHKIVFCSLQSSHFPQNSKLSHDTSATILEWNLTQLKSIKYAKFQNKWWQV